MKASIKSILMHCVLIAMLTWSAYVDAKQIRVFYSSLPPYEEISDKGMPLGAGIEAIDDFFNSQSTDVLFEHFPVARGILELHRGGVDFSTAIAPTKSVKNQFWVSTRALYHIKLGVFRRADTSSLSQTVALKRAEFVSLTGTSFYYLEPEMPRLNDLKNHYRVDNFDLAAGMLRTGKSDYFLSYYYPKKHTRYFDLEFDQFMMLPVHLILSKQHPEAEQLKHLIINN